MHRLSVTGLAFQSCHFPMENTPGARTPAAHGLDPECLTALASAFNWYHGCSAPRESYHELGSDYEDPFHAVQPFQHEILKEGRLSAPCPACGATSFSDDAWPVFIDFHTQPIIYRFHCCIPFDLVIGHQPASLIAVHLPRTNALISLINQDTPYLRSFGASYFDKVMAMFAGLRSIFGDRPAGAPGALPRRPVLLLIGFNANMGHQIREELPAVVKLHATHGSLAAAGVSRLLIGPYDVFGYADLMPGEQPERVLVRNPLTVALTVCRLAREQGFLATRWTSYEHRSTSISARIATVSQAAAGQLPAISGRPVIWITLRSQNRAWTDQVSGFAALITSIREEHPEAAFVFDGMAAEAPVLAAIRARIDPSVPIVDALAEPMCRSIALFHRVDAYVMPYSNACTFPFIRSCPGVVFGAAHFIGDGDGPMTLIPAADGALTLKISGQAVAAENSDPLIEDQYRDFDLDWRRLRAALGHVLASTGMVASGVSGHE